MIDKKQLSSKTQGELKAKLPPPEERFGNQSEKYEEVMGSGGFLNIWWLLPINRQATFAVENELN